MKKNKLTNDGFELLSGHLVQWPDEDGIRVLDSDGNTADIYEIDSPQFDQWLQRFAQELPPGIRPFLDYLTCLMEDETQDLDIDDNQKGGLVFVTNALRALAGDLATKTDG